MNQPQNHDPVPIDQPIASSSQSQTPAPTAGSGRLTRPTSLTRTKITTTSPTSQEPPPRLKPKRRISQARLYEIRQQLGTRDLAVLESLRTWKLLKIEHLRRLHFVQHATKDTALRVARRVLSRLEDTGLIRRLERKIGGVRAGSSGSIFCLSPLGHRLLGGQTKYWREPSKMYGDHTLAIAELGSLAIDAARTAQVDLAEISTEPNVWRAYSSPTGTKTLKPDLLIRLAGPKFEASWFIEVDLGTESTPTLRKRCQIYLDHYQSDEEQDQHGYYPSVLWVMHSEDRKDALTETIERLHHTHSTPPNLFHVTTNNHAIDRIIDSVR